MNSDVSPHIEAIARAICRGYDYLCDACKTHGDWSYRTEWGYCLTGRDAATAVFESHDSAVQKAFLAALQRDGQLVPQRQIRRLHDPVQVVVAQRLVGPQWREVDED